MLYMEMYLDTPDHLLDDFFADVKDEMLGFTKVIGQTHPVPAERPGFHRLADKDPEARNNSWTKFPSGIRNAICGLREKPKVDSSTAREDYYLSETTHGMMIKIMSDGDPPLGVEVVTVGPEAPMSRGYKWN